ncbi:acyl-CoA:lysophosphatidylglycerol acyltransferase 1-like [Ischnura elegans]|uniref:acyl-CoA:lysophosphatidylglycerol acyltransferase 1-like n=1 Tax=Ischnura elegans TaxID=197161 RepID=UPI001ED88E25|nr:acyl-CoA:lysophosphatidylglycerol acyltransferase 1-like [Ischnura elegans]XP_046384559.1 acyl-CoA:lysophosphatidylglycerol acyltransferase 1-like [Ischnura elegans]
MDPFGVAFMCRCALRVLFVILNNIYCIPTYVVWMMMFFPIKKCHPDLYWRIEGYFFHWLLAMVSMWSWSAGYDIVEIGDDITICLEDRTLVIANHQSTADVPLLMATFNAKKNILPNLMWIMDRIFKYTNFGIVSILHQDFFIVSGKDKRDASLKALVSHLQDAYIPRCRKWMVLFPEGGFLRKRRETSQRFAVKNNLPVLQHVSLPRVGALKTIMNVVGPVHVGSSSPMNKIYDLSRPYELKWVLDITIAYPNGQPLDLPTIVTGQREPCKTFLFYRLYPCKEVPQDDEALTKWLYDRFVEKEQMLEIYYKTGVFPTKDFCAEPIPPQTVSQDCLRFLILHLFFITSSYFHFHLLSYVFSHFW